MSGSSSRRRATTALVALALVLVGGGVSGCGSTGDASSANTPSAAPTDLTKPGVRVSAYAIKGKCASDVPVKGLASSKTYYLPSNPSYKTVYPQYCFKSEATAQELGFLPAPSK